MGHLPEREVCHMRRHIDFDKIGITDDVMFCTVLSNSEDCREFLQRILGIEIEEIVVVGTQVSMKSNFHAKGVRLDVYAKDKKGNAYDIEMQTTKMRELPLRNRYYHSEMDSYQIAEGEKYGNLKHDSCGRFELCRPIFQNLLSCKVEKEAKYFHLLNTLINFLNIYLLRRYIRQRVLHAFFLSFLFIFNEHASPSVP